MPVPNRQIRGSLPAASVPSRAASAPGPRSTQLQAGTRDRRARRLHVFTGALCASTPNVSCTSPIRPRGAGFLIGTAPGRAGPVCHVVDRCISSRPACRRARSCNATISLSPPWMSPHTSLSSRSSPSRMACSIRAISVPSGRQSGGRQRCNLGRDLLNSQHPILEPGGRAVPGAAAGLPARPQRHGDSGGPIGAERRLARPRGSTAGNHAPKLSGPSLTLRPAVAGGSRSPPHKD